MSGLMLGIFDPVYMINHLVVNVLSVDVINHGFEHTICQNELLACCDPFNKWDLWIGWFPINGWLLGHFFAYALAGCFYGKDDPIKQFNVALGQAAWFWFEFWTYRHTYEWEQLTYYKHSNTTHELGDGVLLNEYKKLIHPCPDLAYYSTWIPIWEDFIYNSAGQALGYYLWIKIYKMAATPRDDLEEKLDEFFIPRVSDTEAAGEGTKVWVLTEADALVDGKVEKRTRLVVTHGLGGNRALAFVPGARGEETPTVVHANGTAPEMGMASVELTPFKRRQEGSDGQGCLTPPQTQTESSVDVV